MYNMYSRNFTNPTFGRLTKKPTEEKCSLDSAANKRRSCAQNDYFLVPHEEVPGLNPGRAKKLQFFQGVSCN